MPVDATAAGLAPGTIRNRSRLAPCCQGLARQPRALLAIQLPPRRGLIVRVLVVITFHDPKYLGHARLRADRLIITWRLRIVVAISICRAGLRSGRRAWSA